MLHNIMMKYNSLNGRAQVSEISAVASRLDSLLENKCPKSNDYLANATSDFHNLAVQLGGTMNSKVKSNYAGLDLERRDCVRSLAQFLKSFRKSSDGTVKANAMVVYDVFQGYGTRMLKKGVDGLTGMIDSLLIDFNAPNVQTAIGAVPGLAERIEALRTVHERFKESRVNYQLERSLLLKSEKTSVLKAAIVDRINKVFLPYLSELSKSEGGAYTSLFNTMVEIVNETNNLVKIRKGMASARGGNKGETPKEPAA